VPFRREFDEKISHRDSMHAIGTRVSANSNKIFAAESKFFGASMRVGAIRKLPHPSSSKRVQQRQFRAQSAQNR
jgi:hypothetical protein